MCLCASGADGLQRNLTAGEIVDQMISMSRDAQERIGHIVVMGTGEPFDNYDELIRAIRILHDQNGPDISLRNITVSTCDCFRNSQLRPGYAAGQSGGFAATLQMMKSGGF